MSKAPILLENIQKFLQENIKDLRNIDISLIMQDLEQQTGCNQAADSFEILERICSNRISVKTPDYQFLAARIALYRLYESISININDITPLKVLENNSNYYHPELKPAYTEQEWQELAEYIVIERDQLLTYAAVRQAQDKYLIQNRITKQVFETPQVMFMLISAALFKNESPQIRMSIVKRFYDSISTLKISLPTPILAGMRSRIQQISSCVLLDTEDSLYSIKSVASDIISHISRRAGLGINLGRIRSKGAPIREGDAVHTGNIPFYKLFAAAVSSCCQGGVRHGAATFFFPIWHLEVEDLLVLKNNRGTEENRIRHMDYAVQISKLFYQRLLQGGNITLFCPSQVTDLYEAFFKDQQEFERLYVMYEQDASKRKITISARDLFSKIMIERSQTGRIYIQNVDHCNEHSSFITEKATVYGSNLCMEITLPTRAIVESNTDVEPEVSSCILGAINLGYMKNLEELDELSELIVRALDNVVEHQAYVCKLSEQCSKSRRNIGVGITNLAYYLAKNHIGYNEPAALELMHTTMEAFQYSLLNASCKLAQERGRCDKFHETKYSQGLLPIDHYKKEVDELIAPIYKKDWDTLRKQITIYGLRNSTLSCVMPCEASSLLSNSTNGIEPPRGLLSVRSSKSGSFNQIIPEIYQYKNQYNTCWSLGSNDGYLKICAVIQKFIDQAMSVNTYYDPNKFPDRKVPLITMLEDLIWAYRYGLKTLYYHNTRDGTKSEDCDSCKV